MSGLAIQATQTSRVPSPVDNSALLELLHRRLGGIPLGGLGWGRAKEETPPESPVQDEAATVEGQMAGRSALANAFKRKHCPGRVAAVSQGL